MTKTDCYRQVIDEEAELLCHRFHPDQTAIQIRALSKTYPKGVKALDGLNLDVKTGHVLALIGQNGAGKSTTIKILSTICQPDTGRVRVGGIDAMQQPQRVRQLVGYVSQRGGVDSECTGRENLLLQGRLHGLSDKRLGKRVDELLSKFELGEVADRLSSTYSGGTRRKLDIAIGLFHQPRIVLLDEPTVGLDPGARAALWLDIERMKAEGITILLSTHHLEEADRLADRVAILHKGRLLLEGTPDELKAKVGDDWIEVEFVGSYSKSQIALTAEQAGLVEIEVTNGTLRGRSARGAAEFPGIISGLGVVGVKVVAVKTFQPTLENAYFVHTGLQMGKDDE